MFYDYVKLQRLALAIHDSNVRSWRIIIPKH